MKYAFLALVIFLASCGSSVQPETSTPAKNQSKVSYLIFGVFCGESIGQRQTLYKVDDSILVRDMGSGLYDHPLTYKFTKIISDTSKYRLAVQLIDKIPNEFLHGTKDGTVLHDTVHRTYGCPDCGDQCGIYAEFANSDTVKRLWIDTDTSCMPIYAKTFGYFIDSLTWEIAK